ncbi:aminotransferase [Leeuwenhoekiella sp. ZYFB001]|uniref:aminotransferase n=1 Tax=Leeuwenhoekiella sp. ZYFB001 TaxID=2719912 RepID=UPI0014321ED8|nr:aminotransferase [Leeuwenhoekiella sp. ZYFB001]
MATLKLSSSSSKGDFKVLDGAKELCEVVYKNWFSSTAITNLKKSVIEIKPKNIWTSKVDLFKNDRNVGDITFNLKGQMVIRYINPDRTEVNYILKNVSGLKLKFEVYNAEKQLQFKLICTSKCHQLSYNYEVEPEAFDKQTDLEELLVYCGYAANLYISIISAAAL